MKKEIPWNLIISKLKQEITEEDDRRLMEWLSDSENKDVFEELCQVWQKVRERSTRYIPNTNKYWNELTARMKKQETASRRSPFIPYRRYVAAACLVLAIALSSSFFYYIGAVMNRPEAGELTYTTLGGKSKVTLPDGTQVWLHSNTSLCYNTTYRSGDRQVNISGEAYFDVAHNKDKPFIVQTNGMQIMVHGTKFNIETFPESEHTFVSLLEGSVALKTAKESRFLIPGEVATFNKKSQCLEIMKGDVIFASLWAKDQLVFTKKTLGEVCHFLSKWYLVKINLDPNLNKEYLYTFTLRDESLEEILRLMSYVNPIDYRFSLKNELTIFPKRDAVNK